MTIKISMHELECIFKLLIDKAKNQYQIQDIEVETDYYWIITTDEWENFNCDSSPAPAVGSLIDDWECLQKILRENNIVTFVDYDRFASILRAISETVNPSKDH